MRTVEEGVRGEGRGLSRILDKELFLYFFDLEVKRARRYQNFLSLLLLKMKPFLAHDEGDLQACYRQVLSLLLGEMRETDLFGALEEDRLGALLPYADESAGGCAKLRLEGILRDYDFKSRGYEITVEHICFPVHGTNTFDLIRRI